MTKQHHKSDPRLHQTKYLHQHVRGELDARLSAFDDQFYTLTQGQQFYQQALITLSTEEQEPDWQIGAFVVHQQLRLYSDQLTQQLSDLRHWVKRQ